VIPTYKTTLKILATCVALQVLQGLCPAIIALQVFSPAAILRLQTIPIFLIGLLLHMFSHAGWAHLCGNMFRGLPCMLYLEARIGSKRLLDSYVLCGVMAACVQALMPFGGDGLIGASGAIFGLFGLCCGLWGRGATQALIAAIMLALALIPQMQYLNLGMLATGVAFGAHIGGMVTGLLIAIFLLKRG